SIATGRTRAPRPLPSYAEILIIVATLAMGLVVFTYGIATEYDELFIGLLITAGFGFAALLKAGLINRVSAITAKHRNVTMIGAFVAAAAFPFTQSDDQYATIGVYILIFATVALGLNIVVGLAGLLDLGYVAFLGVGAYTAAMVSGSPSSPFDIHLPFWASALLAAFGRRKHRPPVRQPPAALGQRPPGRLRRDDLRCPHRRPDAPAARRLPRHRHPGLRLDLPHRRPQHRRHLRTRRHQRPQRHLLDPEPQHPGLRLRPGAHHLRVHHRPVRQLLPAD